MRIAKVLKVKKIKVMVMRWMRAVTGNDGSECDVDHDLDEDDAHNDGVMIREHVHAL